MNSSILPKAAGGLVALFVALSTLPSAAATAVYTIRYQVGTPSETKQIGIELEYDGARTNRVHIGKAASQVREYKHSLRFKNIGEVKQIHVFVSHWYPLRFEWIEVDCPNGKTVRFEDVRTQNATGSAERKSVFATPKPKPKAARVDVGRSRTDKRRVSEVYFFGNSGAKGREEAVVEKTKTLEVGRDVGFTKTASSNWDVNASLTVSGDPPFASVEASVSAGYGEAKENAEASSKQYRSSQTDTYRFHKPDYAVSYLVLRVQQPLRLTDVLVDGKIEGAMVSANGVPSFDWDELTIPATDRAGKTVPVKWSEVMEVVAILERSGDNFRANWTKRQKNDWERKGWIWDDESGNARPLPDDVLDQLAGEYRKGWSQSVMLKKLGWNQFLWNGSEKFTANYERGGLVGESGAFAKIDYNFEKKEYVGLIFDGARYKRVGDYREVEPTEMKPTDPVETIVKPIQNLVGGKKIPRETLDRIRHEKGLGAGKAAAVLCNENYRVFYRTNDKKWTEQWEEDGKVKTRAYTREYADDPWTIHLYDRSDRERSVLINLYRLRITQGMNEDAVLDYVKAASSTQL
ncbi:MAG: hypothetical protein AAF585_21225 [Verrucomicrobiota bacterium]